MTYPEPKPVSVKRMIAFDRWRIVVQAFDEDQARETVEKIKALGIPCDLEQFITYCDQDAETPLAEAIVTREFNAVAFAPADEPQEAP